MPCYFIVKNKLMMMMMLMLHVENSKNDRLKVILLVAV